MFNENKKIGRMHTTNSISHNRMNPHYVSYLNSENYEAISISFSI